MAKLSEEEQSVLKRLTDKAKAPDGPTPFINFSFDLSDDKAYERAVKLGIIPGDDDGGDDSKADEPDETPKRKGYFGD